MEGEYPAAAKPDKNRPISIMGTFWAEAMKIQPNMSGTAIIMMATRWPYLEPKMAAAKPPKMAPKPKMPAIHDPDSMSRGKGW